MDVRLPDGTIVTNVPEGITQSELMRRVGLASEAPAPEEQGFMDRLGRATKRGLGELGESVSGIALGAKAAVGATESAGRQAEQIRKEAEAERGQPAPISWDELEKTYGKDGAIAALKKMPAYLAEQILQSAPSMAVPLGAAAAAGAVSGPLAPITAPIAGIGTYGLQQFGQFMKRQAEEGATGETLAPGKAALAAAVSAPIGFYADKLTLGMGKIPEKILGEQAAKELAKRVGANVGTRAAAGATVGVIAEAPTEVLEQMTERWQAGLPLKGDDAMREYKEAFFGAAAVGGVGGAGARALSKPKVETAPPAPEQEEKAKEEQLLLGAEKPFYPTPLPDGSIAMTREELAQYEEDQFKKKYEPQKADEAEMLRLTSEEPFKPVVFPDGSVATTPEEVAQYEEEQFQKKYAPQKAEELQKEEPYTPASQLTKTDIGAELAKKPSAGGELADILSARRTAEEQKAAVPATGNYEFMQREKQRLLGEEATPQNRATLKEIDAKIQEYLAKSLEQQRKDKELSAKSLFSEKELPPVEERNQVMGERALAELQAKEGAPETAISRSELKGLRDLEKMRKEGAPTTELQAQIEEIEKARRQIKSTNLRNDLKGKLSVDEVADISPGGKGLFDLSNKNGTYISELVSDGALDNYLPPHMRSSSSTFDSQASAEYLKEKLRDKNHLTFDAEMELRKIDNTIEQMRGEFEKSKQVQADIAEATGKELPDFKRANNKVASIGKESVQSIVDTVKSRFQNAPEVVVAESMNDPVVPEEVRAHNEDQIKKGATGSPQGFFYKGKAYVIADQVSTPGEAVEAMLHEVVGHYGLRGAFGKDMEKVLADLVKNRKSDVEAKAKEYGLDVNNKDDMLKAAEEVLAVMAQQKPGLPFVRRAIAAIRNWLRDHGINLKMSDADIMQKFIMPAHRFVESGAKVAVKGEAAFARKQPSAPSTDAGRRSLDILASMGRFVEEDTGRAERAKQIFKDAVNNPELTAKAAKTSFGKFADKVETWTFSSDAALNNRIRDDILNTSADSKEKLGALLNVSLSQTVHADAVASLFLQKGNIEYNTDLHKWEGKESKANAITLSKQIDAIAEKNGLTKEEAQLIAHTAFEAKRTKSLVEFNEKLQTQIDNIKAEARSKRNSSPVAASALSEKASRLQGEFKYIHLSDEQIAAGLDLIKLNPELNDVVKTWNDMRANVAKVMVDSGLWSQEESDIMLDNMDYVPFYREDQLEQGKGPKEHIRGLKVAAKEKKLKGSALPVNDILDNQIRWMQYAINRAVRNRSALALADTAMEVGAAKSAEKAVQGKNITRVWRDGKEEFIELEDPMFMDAFNGLEAIAIPSWKWAANLSNMLRQSVVMYPLFSVAQIPQDSIAAIFSSGLKPQYALRIPVLAVKEFLQTLRGQSRTHNILKNVGAVGVRDFTSAMVRQDAEVFAGLKGAPGFWGNVKGKLNHFAMAADNSVRQAVFEAAEAQGLSRAEAMEKSFEVFNVRRKGSSKTLALAGQVIPFFQAYLAAQHVTYKVITGRGTSPTERADAFKTLAATTASVMTLSLIYAMLNGDDEDYLKKPTPMRDRLLMIPGTGGLSIPMRSDLFAMPKIITEHMYMMLTDKGYEDGRKFRDSMKNAFANSILGPTPVPQAIKPLVEVGINYDFMNGRPLVGTYHQGLDTARQFTNSTSELAKILGSTGMVSPIAADHLIRGMFGSVGGLLTYMTNPILHSDPNVERPELSMRDAMAALPGTSGFVSKSYESALKRDFYVLKEETDKVAKTMSDLKSRSPQEIDSFLAEEKNAERLGLSKGVNKIADTITKINKAIAQVTNSTDLSSTEKRAQIKELRDAEQELLQSVNVKELRKIAQI